MIFQAVGNPEINMNKERLLKHRINPYTWIQRNFGKINSTMNKKKCIKACTMADYSSLFNQMLKRSMLLFFKKTFFKKIGNFLKKRLIQKYLLWVLIAIKMFLHCKTLDPQSLPWTGNLCLGHHLQLWITPSGHKIDRECLHIPRKIKLIHHVKIISLQNV